MELTAHPRFIQVGDITINVAAITSVHDYTGWPRNDIDEGLMLQINYEGTDSPKGTEDRKEAEAILAALGPFIVNKATKG